MSRTSALLWKEWREQRAFLFIGLGVFLGLPLIGAWQAVVFFHHARVELLSSIWVFSLGGLLAILIAVGATCRDLSAEDLHAFWLSRPVGSTRWLLIKYLTGLAILWAVCILPLLADLALRARYGRAEMDAELGFLLVSNPFVLLALYSVAFLIGCLIRRSAQATTVAIAAGLLIYFVPYVAPPLGFLSVSAASYGSHSWRLTDPAQVTFTAGMLAIAVPAVVLAVWAVRQDWRIEADRRLTYWSIGLAGLILLASAAFQLGSNLPVEAQVSLGPERRLAQIHLKGNRGILWVAGDWHSQFLALRTVEVAGTQLHLGPEITLTPDRRPGHQATATTQPAAIEELTPAYPLRASGVWAMERPELAYFAAERSHTVNGVELPDFHLVTVRLDGQATPAGGPIIHRLHLWSATALRRDPDMPWTTSDDRPWLHIEGQRLYALSGAHLAVLDLQDPQAPRLLAPPTTLEWDRSFRGHIDPQTMRFSLPPLPGLPAAQRLHALMEHIADWWCGHCKVDDQTLLVGWPELRTFRLARFDEQFATFQQVGEYKPSLLERILDLPGSPAAAGYGWAYAATYFGPQGRSPVITVLDAHQPRNLRRVAHFAVPDEEFLVVAPLPDGRALIGGSTLYLVGAPRQD